MPWGTQSIGLILALLLGHSLAHGQTTLSRAQGQRLYLPIYSHIWHGDVHKNGQPMKTPVSVAVSIRNTDPVQPIRVMSATYFDTDGRKIREYVGSPKVVDPMATHELFVPLSDDEGGSGANFVITWKSDQEASQPLVQAIHANLPAGRSIVFTSAAYVLPAN